MRRHVSKTHNILKECSLCDYKNRLLSQVKRHEQQSHGITAVACSVSGCKALMPYRKINQHIRENHPDTINYIDQKSETLDQNFYTQLAAHKMMEENGANPGVFVC